MSIFGNGYLNCVSVNYFDKITCEAFFPLLSPGHRLSNVFQCLFNENFRCSYEVLLLWPIFQGHRRCPSLSLFEVFPIHQIHILLAVQSIVILFICKTADKFRSLVNMYVLLPTSKERWSVSSACEKTMFWVGLGEKKKKTRSKTAFLPSPLSFYFT